MKAVEYRWSMSRGSPGSPVVLIIGSRQDRLARVVTELAEHPYRVFATLPAGASGLCAFARFDVVLVLGDIESDERVRLVDRCSPVRVVQTEAVEGAAVVEAVRRNAIHRPA